MKDNIDYSIYYRRWHKDTLEDMEHISLSYEHWLGNLIHQHETSLKVLDYGCGFGGLTFFLKKYFPNIWAVDSSEQQVIVAKKYLLNVLHLPLESFTEWTTSNHNEFDIIFLIDVLEHIPVREQITFITSLTNTLKDNGIIYIRVPNANSPLANRWLYNDWTHYSSFTECSLEFVCLNAGLDNILYLPDILDIKPKHWWLPTLDSLAYYIKSTFRGIWRFYLLSELGKQALKIPLGVNLFIRATKKT